MKFAIRNRWTRDVQFEAEINCDESASAGIKIGLALKWALTSRSDLRCAKLRDADLRCADLGGAKLSGADLSDADLRGADLSDADLSDANLRCADLGGAKLSGADLSDADLSDANLRCANLRYADLRYANLRGADLGGADLGGAKLSGANLRDIRADFVAAVLAMPNELDALRETIIAGKIDGSTYSGECSCLAGTLAKAKGIRNYSGGNIENGVTFKADASSPRERFFLGIKRGDTPETNPLAKIALEWTDEAIAMRNNIRAHMPSN